MKIILPEVLSYHLEMVPVSHNPFSNWLTGLMLHLKGFIANELIYIPSHPLLLMAQTLIQQNGSEFSCTVLHELTHLDDSEHCEILSNTWACHEE